MEEILNYLNNYFFRFYEAGEFDISSNSINVQAEYLKGQYILIQGSVLNDGVYKIKNFINNKDLESILEDNIFEEDAPDHEIKIEPEENIIELWDRLEPEVFTGKIYSLAVPKSLEKLKDDIEAFKANNKNSVIISESFGGYSYTKQTDKNGNIANWKNAFSDDLKPYRKVYSGIERVKKFKKEVKK